MYHPLEKILHLSLLLQLLWTLPLGAQTIRYVSVSGTNTDPASAVSWATSTTNLQGAINSLSATGGEVWVAAGTYKPTTTTNRAISFSMRNNVTIYGGFPADGTGTLTNRQPTSYTTTLSGNIGNVNTAGDNSYHIINNPASLSLTSSAILDGFVITGGNANGANNDSNGAGIYNDGSSGSLCSPTIRNCKFVNNKVGYSGAGVLNIADGGISSPIITNCTFTSSTSVYGGAGVHNAALNGGTCNPTLTNCIFDTNDGRGVFNSSSLTSGGICEPVLTNCDFSSNYGGLYNDRSNPRLVNCNFTNNFVGARGGFGAGILSESSNPFLINCTFTNNSALLYGGGMCITGGNPVLVNCSFIGNRSQNDGGGIYYVGSNFQLVNCSLINNRSDGGVGGGLYNYNGSGGTTQLTNCVLWNNGGEKTFSGSTPPIVSYSLFEPEVYEYTYTDGGNNLTTSTSPFVSSTDFQLKVGSPAINAGNNLTYTAANGPATDLAGNVRIQYGLIDMGAYESAFSHDLTPVTYVSPSTHYGTSNFNVVIDAVELNSVASRGVFAIKITKDAKAALSFSPTATSVGGRAVQNSAWTFSSTDPNYYVLRTSQSVAAGDKLSVGLTGTLTPGATGGILAISSTMLTEGAIETKLTNNNDADKIEYFQQ